MEFPLRFPGLALTILALVVSSSRAEWQKVAEGEGHVDYVDPATLRVSGDLYRVWELQDLTERGRAGELSRRYYVEYDCAARRVRVLAVSAHAGQMASGSVIGSYAEPGEWMSWPDDTTAEDKYLHACGK